jgi:hypothetical protein
MLIKGDIKQRGVMYPEALDAEICEKILAKLVSDVGLKIYEKVKREWA